VGDGGHPGGGGGATPGEGVGRGVVEGQGDVGQSGQVDGGLHRQRHGQPVGEAGRGEYGLLRRVQRLMAGERT